MLIMASVTLTSCQEFWDDLLGEESTPATPSTPEEPQTPEEPDPQDALYEMAAGTENGKDWTWDDSITSAVWGNMGYLGGSGTDVGLSGAGQWWGVTSTEEFNEQLGHTEDGVNHGDGDMNAFMTLGTDGTIKRCAADGTVINSGTYDFVLVTNNEWKVADLKTTAGAILWPYEINSGGKMPTIFDVVYLTNDKMTLVYPDGGDFSALGNWNEATFWHFKAK